MSSIILVNGHKKWKRYRRITTVWLTDPNVTFFYIIFLFGWGLWGPPNYQGGRDGSLGDVSRWGLVGKSKFSVFLDVCTNSLECWGGGEKSHFSVLHYKFSRFSNFVHPRARWQTDLGYSRSSNISQGPPAFTRNVFAGVALQTPSAGVNFVHFSKDRHHLLSQESVACSHSSTSWRGVHFSKDVCSLDIFL